jgi:hypothetical protein
MSQKYEIIKGTVNETSRAHADTEEELETIKRDMRKLKDIQWYIINDLTRWQCREKWSRAGVLIPSWWEKR